MEDAVDRFYETGAPALPAAPAVPVPGATGLGASVPAAAIPRQAVGGWVLKGAGCRRVVGSLSNNTVLSNT